MEGEALRVLGVHSENAASDAQAVGCIGVLYSQDALSFVTDGVIPLLGRAFLHTSLALKGFFMDFPNICSWKLFHLWEKCFISF